MTQLLRTERVLIVDDQPLVRGGFRMLVDSQPDLTVVSEAGDGAEAVAWLERHTGTELEPTVVLMDVRMPRMDGIEATRRMLRLVPGVKVIVLTTFDLDEYALDAIRSGANGFLLKDARPEELLEAIRTVARGDAVIAPSTTRRLLSHLVAGTGADAAPSGSGEPGAGAHGGGGSTAAGAGAPSAPWGGQDPWSQPHLARLTAREREVFTLVGQGLSNGEITETLFLSEPTVKTHVSHILAKLGARDRVQAVVMAYESGVVQPS